MSAGRPYVVVLGGPNGAGKTTIASEVLANTFGLLEFVNADVIAQGLSAFDPEGAAFEAGRLMLKRLRHLADQRACFAFESTLSSRTFAPWLRRLQAGGYDVHVIYVWLPTPELAVRRVRARVRRGGHSIPEPVVRRRFRRSARNFLQLYSPLATSWSVLLNASVPLTVAQGRADAEPVILEPTFWSALNETANQEDQTGAEELE